MKTTYVYYPGATIAIIILILNVTHIINIDYVWVFISLFLGWVVYSHEETDIKNDLSWMEFGGVNDIPSLSNPTKNEKVVWFPLIKKFLKKI